MANAMELCLVFSSAINHFVTQQRGVTVLEYAVTRNGINFILIALIVVVRNTGYFTGFTKDNLAIFFVRAFFGNAAYITMTWAYKLIPLGIGATIIAANPILITCISHFFLGERASLIETAAIVVSLIGVLLLGTAKMGEGVEGQAYIKGVLLAGFTCFGMTMVTILGRKLKSVDTECLMFNQFAIGTAIAVGLLLGSPYEYDSFRYDQGSTYTYILVGGLFNFLCLYLFTYASQHSVPTTLALLRYIGVFYSFLFDLTVFKESFTLTQYFGVALILATNIASVAYKLKLKRAVSSSEEKLTGEVQMK